MPDTPRAVIVSASPGRLRLRFPVQQNNAAFFRLLGQNTLMLPGVTASVTNPLTGSLLIRFRGTADAVLMVAARQRIFRAEAAATPRLHPSATHLAPLGAAALGFLAMLQAGRGAVLPPAFTLVTPPLIAAPPG